MIIDYALGHTGSVHDSWAFRSTRIFLEHETILGPGEWIWADSAYPVETWCVPPFKKPAHGELTPDQRTFNYHLSKVISILFDSKTSKTNYSPVKIRIRIEHAIGLLKGRFQSLFELRIQVFSHDRHLWAIMWVRCCIILHNLILCIEGGGFDEAWRTKLLEEGLERGMDTEGYEAVETDSDGQEEGDDAELRRARRRLTTSGQHFRYKVMDDLFDSPESGAVRRT